MQHDSPLPLLRHGADIWSNCFGFIIGSDDMTNLPTLIAKAKAATPGPWVGNSTEGWNLSTVVSQLGDNGKRTATICDALLNRDAAFIAAANPQTILDLATRLQRAKEDIKRLNYCLDNFWNDEKRMDDSHFDEHSNAITRAQRISKAEALTQTQER
jgi:hypothetical protein